MVSQNSSSESLKRKHEDDDDYDALWWGNKRGASGPNLLQNGRPPVQPAHWNTSAAAAEKLLWPYSNKLTPSLLSIFLIKSGFIDLIWKIYEEILEDFRGIFC